MMISIENSKIIDNTPDKELVKVLKDRLKKSWEAKFAVGYFFLSGFNLVDEDFPHDVQKTPFLKLIIGDETTLDTKEELVSGYQLREMIKHEMIEELQAEELTDRQKEQLKRLRDYVANDMIEIRLFDKSRLHAKLYLFLKDVDDKYGSPGVAIVGSSNFTAAGLTKNKELNVLLTEREDVLYLNHWFDTLWREAIEFNEDLLKVIDISGVLPGSKYPKLGKFVDPLTLFKYLVYEWTEGRVLNLIEKDVLMEFQLVGVINAVNILNYYNGVILADSVGLGKSFMASTIIQEFLNGKHPHWLSKEKGYPAVMLILPPSLISQWEDLLVGRSTDSKTLSNLENGKKVKITSEFFFKNYYKKMVKGDYNHKVYEIYDENHNHLLGKIAFLSLGIFQNYKADLKKGVVSEKLKIIAEEYDLFVIDEAHKYRNKNTNRWKALKSLQRKANNFPNKFLLLTATPLNNTIEDLYNLIRLFTDDTFITFRMKNISVEDLLGKYKSLKREYEKKKDDGIKKETKKVATEIKRKVLDEIMVLRTRRYILEQFKDLTVNGKKLVFKEPRPCRLDYSPFYTNNFYEVITRVSSTINDIRFEHTKLYGVRYIVFADEDEGEDETSFRMIEIADLFRLLLGKRLESGIFAFETTLRKIYEKEKTFYAIFKNSINQIMSEEDFKALINEALQKASIQKDLDEELSREFDADVEKETRFDRIIKLLAEYVEEYNLHALDPVDMIKEGLKIVLRNLEHDLKLMDEILEVLDKLKVRKNGDFKVLGTISKQEGDISEVRVFCYDHDPKLEVLKQLIAHPRYKSQKLSSIPTLNGKKFIVFTQYKHTAHYLYHNLREWIEREIDLHPWLKDKDDRIKIALVTGETDTPTRINIMKRFAPRANAGEEEVRQHGEVEILISTDALSEGVNLQDADAVVNFDLPWNPMVIVQRVGRVNRIGNEKEVYVLNFIPSGEIEVLVGILSKLKQKIEDITLVVGKESKILSQEEEINVETFGERIKSMAELSMTDLEEFTVSDEFKQWFEGGMPQEQLDDYRLLNIIQHDLGLTKEDFKEVRSMVNAPYYTYVKSGSGKTYSIYEFYRGGLKIDKKIISIDDENELMVESPLTFLELVRNRKIDPMKLDIAAERLKKIETEIEKEVESLKKGYQKEQKGIIKNLYDALILEIYEVEQFENYESVLNALQLLSHYQYSTEIRSLLVKEGLIEVSKKNDVKIKNVKGVMNTLYTHFLKWGIADIKSLRVEKRHLGWFHGY